MRRLCAVCAACLLVALIAPGEAHANSKALDDAATAGALTVPLAAGIISLAKDDWPGAWQLGFTYAATMGTTLALKKTVHETRPNGNPESFPSGHAASAFAGAAYLQRRYGWGYAIPAYAVGAFVGYARVHNDKHHWHDILASAVLANVSAFFITKPYERNVDVSLVADPISNSYRFSAALRF
jgi:membrane-associated phospholipid phosphatase